ncbi:MAG TPA: hypothetical protein VK427_13640 [Kofleriaceae bacterium]|nr:hypothetical protein [Kofleriaceae bacterium]
MRLAIVCLVIACKSDAPATLDGVAVTLGGKPRAIDRAFLRTPSPDVHVLTLGAGKGSCTADGDLGIQIIRRVAATGHDTYVVEDVWSRDLEVSAPRSTATVDGAKLTLAIDGASVRVHGSLVATECPALPLAGAGVPKARHPAKASITVARRRLDVRGAIVTARPGVAPTDFPDIRISTSPLDCSATPLTAPVILSRQDKRWTLAGSWFEAAVAETDAQGLGFTANDVGKSLDGPTITLQLLGTGKLGDYTVKLDGTVEAIECVSVSRDLQR